MSLYALSLGAAQTQGAFHDLIGKDWAPVKEIVEAVDNAAKEVAAYQANHKDELAGVCATGSIMLETTKSEIAARLTWRKRRRRYCRTPDFR